MAAEACNSKTLGQPTMQPWLTAALMCLMLGCGRGAVEAIIPPLSPMTDAISYNLGRRATPSTGRG